ncbi:MAG: 30S ribosomal protein S17 [Deltaproteobacteria bacterium]|nr:30S ribosomal protein S17 [Deltaproteobacteria bacterium]
MSERGVKKKLLGIVVAHNTDKTAVVSVRRVKKHKVYQKYITVQKKYMVHDPQNRCVVGDKVRIVESRPISKMKRWMILDVLGKSMDVDEAVPESEEAVRV